MVDLLLKRLYIILFTKNPYKVIPFNQLNKYRVGQPVHLNESLTAVIKREEGAPLFYPPYPESYDVRRTSDNLDHILRYKTGGLYKEADRYLYSIQSGHIIGYLGLIYDRDSRRFIDESAKLWVQNLKKSHSMNFYRRDPPTYLPGIALSCMTIGADGGFYHFFYEVLPKFFFCRDILHQVDHILLNGPKTDWKEKWLIKIGIDFHKVIWIDNTSHFKFKQLLFTNRLINDQQVSKWSIGALKHLLGIPALTKSTFPDGKKIVWITRKNVSARVIEWEDKLLSAFPEIEKIDTRDLKVAETITLFGQATHIISPHGAGLCNIIMSRPGTKVLELFPELANYQPCYFRTSSICELEHYIAEVNFADISGYEACKNVIEKFVSV